MQLVLRKNVNCVLAALLSLSILSGCKDPAVTPKDDFKAVDVIKIASDQTDTFRNFPATVGASNLVELAFRIRGQLIEINTNAGTLFKKGDVLARLDPSDYQRRVNDLTSTFELSKKNLARAEKLLPGQAISQSEYDLMKAQYLINEANLNLAKQELEYTILRAPKDGRISFVPVENFEVVEIGQSVIHIEDYDKIEILVQVPEKLAGVAKGDDRHPAQIDYSPDVFFTTFPEDKFQARYLKHETELDPETKSYIYTLVMEAPSEQTILPGMSATVQVNMSTLSRARSAIILPNKAVFFEPDQSVSEQHAFVWTYDSSSKTAKKQSVRVGELVKDGIQVIQGLSPNDIVIVDGGSVLMQGQKVIIKGDV